MCTCNSVLIRMFLHVVLQHQQIHASKQPKREALCYAEFIRGWEGSADSDDMHGDTVECDVTGYCEAMVHDIILLR